MYDMGVSRINKSQLNKSLQIFCPLWLEDFNESNIITFKVGIFTKQKVYNEHTKQYEFIKDIDITKDLKLNIKDGCDYHNKFVEYFNNYIKSISETTDNNRSIIGDKLINIDLNNTYMSLEGINVENGKKVNKNISHMLPNILTRFKPMMDTDSMIINNFPNNNVISKQLFNFNLIFDIEDILSYHIFTQLIGKKLFFEVKCFIDDKELPLKSFSYDYSKDFNIKNSNPLTNTLDFFEDYNSIQLMDKNKISPQIIHWASVHDNDYIFNIYPDAIWNTNLWGTNVEQDNLCLHWCNNDLMFGVDTRYVINKDEVTKDNNLLVLINNITPIDNYSSFNTGKTFINNVFYEYDGDDFNEKKIYINIIEDLISKNRISDLRGKLHPFDLMTDKLTNNIVHCGYIYKRGNGLYNILIDKKYMNALSFNMMKVNGNASRIDEACDKDNVFEGFKFKTFLNKSQESKIITINNSISMNKADSPNGYENKTNEINYGKAIIPTHYIFRTDGHFKPAFVDGSECDHYMIKKISRQEYNENWDKLIKTKFPALYPSINYFFIEKIDRNDFSIENKWFNDSEIFILAENINFTIEKNVKIDKRPIKENLINLLKSYYNIYQDKVIEYIYNLYNIDMYFDYLYENSVDDYKYIIKMTLK
jgi:hypothetical protein